MSSSAERPVWRTGWLWGVLAVLLVLGSAGAATLVYGLLGVASGVGIDAIVAGFGAVVALLSMLFMIGILYRVDRYRGALGRRVELFE
jgi:hypothetical protein